jgi:hypothetical protein
MAHCATGPIAAFGSQSANYRQYYRQPTFDFSGMGQSN